MGGVLGEAARQPLRGRAQVLQGSRRVRAMYEMRGADGAKIARFFERRGIGGGDGGRKIGVPSRCPAARGGRRSPPSSRRPPLRPTEGGRCPRPGGGHRRRSRRRAERPSRRRSTRTPISAAAAAVEHHHTSSAMRDILSCAVPPEGDERRRQLWRRREGRERRRRRRNRRGRRRALTRTTGAVDCRKNEGRWSAGGDASLIDAVILAVLDIEAYLPILGYLCGIVRYIN
jgi:hypothetical protein